MITSFFISVVAWFLSLMIAVLPVSSGLPVDLQSSLESIAASVNSFNFLFPVSTLFDVVGFTLAFEVLWWTFWGIFWLYKRLPFIGK